MRHAGLVAVIALAGAFAGTSVFAQPPDSDDYTRYELLAPETAQFRIVYEVTATTPGAAFYFNPIRKGSEASDEAVYDRASGKPLRFEVVSGAEARAAGQTNADLDTRYIKVHLPRPVPSRRRAAPAHRQDLPRSQELLRGGRPPRVRALARRQAQRRRAAAGLRARRLQRAGAGAARRPTGASRSAS